MDADVLRRADRPQREARWRTVPNFNLLVHGGVNFEPYRAKLMDSIGRKVTTIETFPASEGFFAYQDTQQQEGLLLNTNAGIFFEFVPAGEIFLPILPASRSKTSNSA